jgi:malate/lactate dehydrogenase
MDSTDMKIIAEENRVTKNEIDTEIKECKARTQPAYICITNAADLTCYYLLNSLTLYPIFGQGTLLQICLLVTSMSDVQKTSAYLMEVEDLGHGCLSSINIYSNAKEAFQDCCLIIMLDSLHKLPSESHASWLERNAELFYALKETMPFLSMNML